MTKRQPKKPNTPPPKRPRGRKPKAPKSPKAPKAMKPRGTPTTKFFNKKWEEVPANKSTYAVTIWHDKKGNFVARRIGIRQGAKL